MSKSPKSTRKASDALPDGAAGSKPATPPRTDGPGSAPVGASGSPTAAIRALLDAAQRHYGRELVASVRPMNYLKDRGITGSVARRYGLGWAPSGWTKLRSLWQPFGLEVATAAGLVAALATGRNARVIDRFRGRIMFPVRDADTGAVLGFGGRLTDGASADPKYINSPEGPCFAKHSIVYGLHEAAQAIEKERAAIVVEGFFDVVTMAQAGFANTVGTMGTACTWTQVTKLRQRAERITFCFDGDDAGRSAALAAAVLVASMPDALDVFRVAVLPDGVDPDSFVRASGAEAMRSCLDAAVPLDALLIAEAGRGLRLDVAEDRVRYARRLADVWQGLHAGPLRDRLVQAAATCLKMPADRVAALY